jgi:chromosome segregation ATPase
MAEDEKDKRIGELEDELKRKKERIGELRDEVDDLRDRLGRMREHLEESQRITESWCETFDMQLTDGGWTWEPFWDEQNQLVDDYNALLARFNALVRDWNTHIAYAKPRRRNVGRPLAASEAQVRAVLRLRHGLSGELVDGQVKSLSLREIAEETGLGLNTVRTIIAQARRTDRTTRKHLARVDPEAIDRQRRARWKRRRRSGNELPKRINNHLKAGSDLLREAR